MPIWVVVEADSIASAIEVLKQRPENGVILHHVHVKGDETDRGINPTPTGRVFTAAGRNQSAEISLSPRRGRDPQTGIDGRQHAHAKIQLRLAWRRHLETCGKRSSPMGGFDEQDQWNWESMAMT